MKNQLIKLTSSLIKFKTTKDNVSEKKRIIDFVEKQFEDCDVYIKKFLHKECYSIVVTLKKEKNSTILLNGHLDVVPAKDEEFIPRIKDKKIYGRGSGDMKAGCAVMIETMKYFSKQKNKPSLGLMLTTDEETGGANGAGYLIDNKKYRPQLVIIPDGGVNLKTIVTHQKGILHLRMKAHGKSAHGARPFLGENAIDKLLKSYYDIKKVFPDVKKGEWKNTLNLGKFYGGEAANKVPHYAEMHLDIRYVKKNHKRDILKKINKLIDDYEIIAHGDVFFQEKNHEYIKIYKKVIEKEIGNKIEFYKVEGASDARYFSKYSIPTIITKINCKNIHADNEWADIDEMVLFYNSLIKFINKL